MKTKGLIEAIKDDEGAQPSQSHRLLAEDRTFLENIVLHMKIPFPGVQFDADHLTADVVSILPTSRGNVELRSANPEDTPKINLNYLSTEVDKCVYREPLRQLTRFMLALGDDDAKLDKRLSLTGMTMWHPSGTCSMGKVVESKLRVNRVEGLRVIDASVLPVPLGAHIQAPVYALAEQAAAIIAGEA
ncbi:GMC oxidoreductase-domain-containing protein [Biscogniauxia marginata]|nr:GMC oxidoreductase-domain-containing protein [Biscogniauxia marginata]